MTDNRTIELRSLSKLKMAGKLHYWRGTIEIPENELYAICNEIQAEHEQAIAATLGNSKPTADAIAELRKTVREAFSGESVSMLVEGHAIMRAIDAVEAATLGSGECEHCLWRGNAIDKLEAETIEYDKALDAVKNERDELKRKLASVEHDYVRRSEHFRTVEALGNAVAERDKLKSRIAKLSKKHPYTFDPDAPIDNLKAIARYIDELEVERDEWKAKAEKMQADADNIGSVCDKLRLEMGDLRHENVELSRENIVLLMRMNKLAADLDGAHEGQVRTGQSNLEWLCEHAVIADPVNAIADELNPELENGTCTASMRDTVDWNGEPMTEHVLEYGESKECCVLHVFKGKVVK